MEQKVLTVCFPLSHCRRVNLVQTFLELLGGKPLVVKVHALTRKTDASHAPAEEREIAA